jgi:type-IV secretion system protein TraC
MKRPLFSFSEFQNEYPLSNELPYWDFLDADDGDCVALADGSLIQGLQLTGIDIETLNSDQLNNLTLQLRSVLNSIADGVELQLLVDVRSDFEELISQHNNQKGNHPLIRMLNEQRVHVLRSESHSGALRRPFLYLFAYFRIQSVSGGLTSFFEKPRMFSRVRREEHDKRVRELKQIVGSLISNLEGAGVLAQAMPSNEIVRLIYQTLNPNRSLEQPAPDLNRHHRSQEFSQEELTQVPELAEPSPREQLAFSDVIQGVDTFFLDGFYHRMLTLKTLPEFTHSALIAKLLALPFLYRLSVQLKVPEQSAELASLQTKRRMAHSMSATPSGNATDLESEAKLHSTEELLRELINTGQKIFYFQMAIMIKEKNLDDLDHHTKFILSRFREMNGAEGLAEGVAGFKVFKSVLPAGNTQIVRPKRIKTDNLADFLPLYQPWEGNLNPICLFRNRMGGLVSYDPFDQSLPNFNTLVTGSSGSGKSFLNNCVLLQYLTQKPLIYIIDIGGSYKKLCESLGGQYIEVMPHHSDQACQSINPFLLPSDTAEPSPQKIKFLLSLLETMLTDEEGEKLQKLDKSLLEEAILATYLACLPQKTPTLSDFAKTLEKAKGDHAQELRDFGRMLYPWTGSRPYGRLLDTDSSFDLNSDLVVFDLKGLSSYPDLQSVMILIITDFILGKVEAQPNQRKRILLDECWELLKSRGASQFMEYCARTLRKTGSGITFITQGLEEIERSPIGPAILNNTASKLILMQRGDLEPIRKILKLNDQEMALISSLRQQKGSFSEAFLMANESRCVIRVVPTPLEYWVSTSDPQDHALLLQAREQFKDLDLRSILVWLATHYPQGSQGPKRLITQ